MFTATTLFQVEMNFNRYGTKKIIWLSYKVFYIWFIIHGCNNACVFESLNNISGGVSFFEVVNNVFLAFSLIFFLIRDDHFQHLPKANFLIICHRQYANTKKSLNENSEALNGVKNMKKAIWVSYYLYIHKNMHTYIETCIHTYSYTPIHTGDT